MNNGGKVEKENTPNEANLQEEEVLRGLVRWRVRPGSEVWAGGRAAGAGASPGFRAALRGGVAALKGLGITLASRRSPELWLRDVCLCPRASACPQLRNSEDFWETF